ncbi:MULTISPECIES: hypothetical protein [unclassified Streptomyces]|uniref:hypothetical protein n=1 Tax=unclassified Streptomyces TaxID=2593676 RepID=UPI0013DD542A|nr:hypothetical protein [Streptomyces sp. RLA2-12]
MEPAAELPTEGAHAHGVTETGDLGAAGLDAVAQLARLGQVPEELGAAPSALGVRLRLPGPFGLLGPFGLFGLFDAAKSSGPFGPIGPFGRIGSSESVQLLRGLLFPVRHRHTTPGPSLPPSL